MKRIYDWKLFKNLKEHEKDQIVQLEDEFEESGQIRPTISLRGRPIKDHKIIRHRKAIKRSSVLTVKHEASTRGRRQVVDLQLGSELQAIEPALQTPLLEVSSSSPIPSRFHSNPPPNLCQVVVAPWSLRAREILFQSLDRWTDTTRENVNDASVDMYNKLKTGTSMLRRRNSRVAWSMIHDGFAMVKDIVAGNSRFLLADIFDLICGYVMEGFEDLVLSLLKHFSKIARVVLGAHHPTTSICYILATSQSRKEIADSAWEVQIHLFRKKVGVADLNTLHLELARANIYITQERYAESESLLKRLLDTSREHFGRHNSFAKDTARMLSWGYRRQGYYSKSDAVLSDIVNPNCGDEAATAPSASIWDEARLDQAGSPKAELYLRRELAYLHLNQGNCKEAEIYLRRILASCLVRYGLQDTLTVEVLDLLERMMIQQGDVEGIEALVA